MSSSVTFLILKKNKNIIGYIFRIPIKFDKCHRSWVVEPSAKYKRDVKRVNIMFILKNLKKMNAEKGNHILALDHWQMFILRSSGDTMDINTTMTCYAGVPGWHGLMGEIHAYDTLLSFWHGQTAGEGWGTRNSSHQVQSHTICFVVIWNSDVRTRWHCANN